MWNLNLPRRTTFGRGALAKVPDEVRDAGWGRPLIVASSRTLQLDPVGRLLESFRRSGAPHSVSARVAQEAPVECVHAIALDYRENGCDSIVAIGGGSVLDLAKAASILAVSGGRIEDCYGVDRVDGPTAPKLLVPTTSGTGSEATNIAIVSDPANKVKRGIVSHRLFAEAIVVDPTLTYDMPASLTLSTGLDAFCQCVEGHVSRNASPVTDGWARQGIRLIVTNLERSLAGDRDARDALSLGAYLSGLVICGGNAGTNVGHAVGNTIGGVYGSAHGVSVAAVIAAGIRFLMGDPASAAKIEAMGGALRVDLIEWLGQVRKEHALPTLSAIGMSKGEIGGVADRVMAEQGRLLQNTAREVTREDVERILRESL